MSGAPTPDPPDGPGGLVVMLRDDPLEAARALAAELGAELVEGGPDAEVLVDRLAALSGHGPHLDLDAMEAGLQRAEYTRDRTRQAVAAKLSRTINTALAIHPDTLRSAAAALVEAGEHHVDALERSFPSTRARVRTLGCGLVALAGVALTVQGAVVGGIAAGVVWSTLAGLSWWFERRRVRLAAQPLRDAEDALDLSRRRWEQLVGVDRSPLEVDDIVARYDPQHDLVGDLIANHPAVRAADSLAALRQADLDRATRVLNERAAGTTEDLGSAVTVVANAYEGLTEQRCRALHRRLLALPPDRRVIVVLRPGPNDAAQPVVDLTDAAQAAPTPATSTDHNTAPTQVGTPF